MYVHIYIRLYVSFNMNLQKRYTLHIRIYTHLARVNVVDPLATSSSPPIFVESVPLGDVAQPICQHLQHLDEKIRKKIRGKSRKKFLKLNWMFPKIVGISPQIIHFHTVFHCKPSIFGVSIIFGNTQLFWAFWGG